MNEAEVRRIARNEVIDAFAFEAGVHGATPPFVSGKHTLREWMALFVEHKDAQHGAGGISEERARAIAEEEDDKLKVTK